jgi:hypothetical protein
MDSNFYTVVNTPTEFTLHIMDKEFPKLYQEITGKIFWLIVKEFIMQKIVVHIDYNEIYLKVNLDIYDGCERTYRKYIEDILENEFHTWNSEAFPTLTKIIKNNMANKVFLSKAVISYQEKYGSFYTNIIVEHLDSIGKL